MSCDDNLTSNGWSCSKPCSCQCKNCLNYKKGEYAIRVKNNQFTIRKNGNAIAHGVVNDLQNKLIELGI